MAARKDFYSVIKDIIGPNQKKNELKSIFDTLWEQLI
jgi:hypothetical protein